MRTVTISFFLLLVVVSCSSSKLDWSAPVYKYTVGVDGTGKFDRIKLIPEDWIGITSALQKVSVSGVPVLIIENEGKLYIFDELGSKKCSVLIVLGIDGYKFAGFDVWKDKLPAVTKSSVDQ